ncbi:hypothetical protein [Dehalogenimonas etheniformans]|uniref:IPT/TIG domain-containing protein n=1 Tax=Dehalogenimonas etheniformans TaxID=1536648 RepID=A0A2P5P6U3_9CHLR|nr:hypothetical protein [Dehalogenimonas etheniformans]PPD58014.1 hypothetical protein JP09_006910 [Dehalogenimonas etheniformans]QNT75364.1 hypothetical protein HX448_00995 [Dehalogenimonas etheniformans]
MKIRTVFKLFPALIIAASLAIGVFISPVSAVSSAPTTGPVGTLVSFSTSPTQVTGTNYTVHFIGLDAGNNTINITVVASTAIPAGGIVTGSFQVPVVPKGNYQIAVLGDGNPTPVNVGTFAVTPFITLSTISATAGTAVTVNGTGFGANLAVNIYFATTAITTGTPVVQVTTAQNANGAFSVPFTLAQTPYLPVPHVVTAIDTALNTYNTQLAILPRIISLSSEAGAVGDTITVNADGFTALGSVSIFFDSLTSTPLVTVAANSSGVIPATAIVIPPAVRGPHTVYVRDNTYTTVFAYKTFTINQSKIILSPASGPVGTNVTVNGTGFGDSVVVGFEFDGTALTGTTVTTDTKGSFSKTLTIANSPSGVHVITAKVTTDAAMFASANFTVSAKITISAATGSTGDQVTINGTGFYPNGQITLAYDSIALPTAPATLTVLANGTFSGVFTVPGAVEGAHTIIAADGLGNLATAVFTSSITAAISPDTSATPGFVGQDITVTGSGFKPGAAITVKLEGNQVATGTSNTAGAFTVAFKAPVIVKGAHPVTVSDGQTTKDKDQDGKPLTFTMEGTAPAGPTLTEPASGIKAKQPITFTWGAVTDQSNPVTYKLEVATDANFTTLIVSKDGLTTTSYTMTDAEKLPTVSKKAPYYWRVIATDAAGNVGAPSTANSFVVGFSWADVPVWAWVTIGFFAVIIIGGGVYLLLRRRSSF